MQIPEQYQQLCKDLAKVLRDFNSKHGWNPEDSSSEKMIWSFKGTVEPSDSNLSDIHFHWESGRHSMAEGQITISTQIRVNTKIDNK